MFPQSPRDDLYGCLGGNSLFHPNGLDVSQTLGIEMIFSFSLHDTYLPPLCSFYILALDKFPKVVFLN